MKQTKQMSETHLLAILLAVVGGFLDALRLYLQRPCFCQCPDRKYCAFGTASDQSGLERRPSLFCSHTGVYLSNSYL